MDIIRPNPPPAAHCWNEKGVRGDRSCDLLAQHGHCRNCPTLSTVAARLLDREAVPDPVPGPAATDRQARDAKVASDQSALVFRLGSEWFAIATRSLDEVTEWRPVHRIPHARSPALLGLANIRGQLVVCVALDRLLGIDHRPWTELRDSRFLVLRTAPGRLAVPVDEVQHTHDYHMSELTAPPANVSRSASSYTSGLLSWRDRSIARLDDARLIAALVESLG